MAMYVDFAVINRLVVERAFSDYSSDSAYFACTVKSGPPT